MQLSGVIFRNIFTKCCSDPQAQGGLCQNPCVLESLPVRPEPLDRASYGLCLGTKGALIDYGIKCYRTGTGVEAGKVKYGLASGCG